MKNNETPIIGINDFVLRQTAASIYSYLDDGGATADWDFVRRLATANWTARRPVVQNGKEIEGQVLISVPAFCQMLEDMGGLGFPLGGPSNLCFKCGVVTVTEETELVARFAARREGEARFTEVLARGEKTDAEYVDLVVYRADVLGKDLTDPANEWEVISINARAEAHEQPPTPMAMARNMLGMEGGTKATYSAMEMAHSILYWSWHAPSTGEPDEDEDEDE